MAESKERRKTPPRATQATPRPDTRVETSSEETRRRIAEAAYFRAKERGFEPGREIEDWVEAESEVMGRINGADR
ncbi:MAG TPA: DUF2934 domain-containing protein [Burkholderiales bacterium]|jgi:hypothetical protein|nr:DUF2934 domain-containing protein [Burkholderiales bacterium]